MTKSITIDGVMKLRPCHSREWVEACFRGRADGRGRLTVAQIAALEDVSDDDKRWLFVRMMGRKMRVLWACDCASRALPAWESYACGRSDMTAAQRGAPRTAIRLARACAKGRATKAAAHCAAAAADDADEAADEAADAAEAARSAAHCAAAAADDADEAVIAVADAIEAAYDAAHSAYYSAASATYSASAVAAAAYVDPATGAAAVAAEADAAEAAYDAERLWQIARAVAYLEGRLGR